MGRPCPHDYSKAADYCRHCSNSVAAKRTIARARVGLEHHYKPVHPDLLTCIPETKPRS